MNVPALWPFLRSDVQRSIYGERLLSIGPQVSCEAKGRYLTASTSWIRTCVFRQGWLYSILKLVQEYRMDSSISRLSYGSFSGYQCIPERYVD